MGRMDYSVFNNGDIEWQYQKYGENWHENALADVATVNGLSPEVLGESKPEEIAQFIQRKRDQSINDPEPSQGQCSTLRGGIFRPLIDPYGIRLLYLRPARGYDIDNEDATFAAPLVCSLQPASVELDYSDASCRHAVDLSTGEPRWYTALSYCWGPPDKSCVIEIVETSDTDQTDKSLRDWPITSNLFAALCHLRAEGRGKTVCLWVDQLCINQADEEEKGGQIKLMTIVYRRALNTAIWLGENANDNADVIPSDPESLHKHLQSGDPEEFQQLLEGVKPMTGLSLLRLLYHNFEGLYGHDNQTLVWEHVELPCARETLWSKLRSILDRPYFHRVWVIQEIMLSKTPVVRIGSEKVHWHVFTAFCLVLFYSGYLEWLQPRIDTAAHWDIFGVCDIIAHIDSMSRQFKATEFKASGIEVSSLLSAARYASATVKKDKIFGVLGMALPETEFDYRMDEKIVNNTITLNFVQRKIDAAAIDGQEVYSLFDNLTLLFCEVDHIATKASPSWIPDWTRKRDTTMIGGTFDVDRDFHAGGRDREDCLAEIHDEGKSLHVNGEVVDSIVDLHKICREVEDLKPRDDSPNPVIGRFLRFVQKHQGQLHGVQEQAKLQKLLWNTLTAGKSSTHDNYDVIVQVQAVLEDSIADPKHYAHHHPVEGKSRGNKSEQSIQTVSRGENPTGPTLLDDARNSTRDTVKEAVLNRRLSVTSNGRLALVPHHARKNDKIAVFAGFRVPYIVRERNRGCFELVGECYVSGIMRGETASMGYKTTTIKLI